METRSYVLKDVPEEFWRKVKIQAISKGLTIQNYIIDILEKDLKIKQKPSLNKRKK